jgi:hypothetical protein
MHETDSTPIRSGVGDRFRVPLPHVLRTSSVSKVFQDEVLNG